VHVTVVDAAGGIVVAGDATADQDPAGALDELTTRLVRDVPPATGTVAVR
jgi:hypothetical protein